LLACVSAVAVAQGGLDLFALEGIEGGWARTMTPRSPLFSIRPFMKHEAAKSVWAARVTRDTRVLNGVTEGLSCLVQEPASAA
jgi:hypothetical protein